MNSSAWSILGSGNVFLSFRDIKDFLQRYFENTERHWNYIPQICQIFLVICEMLYLSSWISALKLSQLFVVAMTSSMTFRVLSLCSSTLDSLHFRLDILLLTHILHHILFFNFHLYVVENQNYHIQSVWKLHYQANIIFVKTNIFSIKKTIGKWHSLHLFRKSNVAGHKYPNIMRMDEFLVAIICGSGRKHPRKKWEGDACCGPRATLL